MKDKEKEKERWGGGAWEQWRMSEETGGGGTREGDALLGFLFFFFFLFLSFLLPLLQTTNNKLRFPSIRSSRVCSCSRFFFVFGVEGVEQESLVDIVRTDRQTKMANSTHTRIGRPPSNQPASQLNNEQL